MALAVTVVVDVDANCSRNEDSEGQRSTKVYRMFSEVEGVGSVNCGEESEAAPADVIASAVVLNIHRCEISRLPEEELVAVNKLQTHVDHHGVTHIPVPFILSKCVGDCADGPEDHSESAVCELFHVPSKDTGVKFSAPVIVKQDIASRATVSA